MSSLTYWIESTGLEIPGYLRWRYDRKPTHRRMAHYKSFVKQFPEILELYHERLHRCNYRLTARGLSGKRGELAAQLFFDTQRRVFEQFYSEDPRLGYDHAFDARASAIHHIKPRHEPLLFDAIKEAYRVLGSKPCGLKVYRLQSDFTHQCAWYDGFNDFLIISSKTLQLLSPQQLIALLQHEVSHILQDRSKIIGYSKHPVKNHQIEFTADLAGLVSNRKRHLVAALQKLAAHEHEHHYFVNGVYQCIIAECKDMLPDSLTRQRLIANLKDGCHDYSYRSTETHPSLAQRIAQISRVEQVEIAAPGLCYAASIV